MKKSDILALIKAGFEDGNANRPVESGSGPMIQVMSRSETDPKVKGLVAARIIRSLAAGKMDTDRAIKYAKDVYKIESNDPVIKALSAGSNTAGGFLLEDQWAPEILGLLRPKSVVRAMGATVLPMTTGTLRIRKITGGAVATYIGENQNIPKTEETFGELVLSWKKLGAIVPISNDLLRMDSGNVDQMVRDDLVLALAQREDQAFIRDDGSVFTPTGLRNLVLAGNVVTATQAGAIATQAEVTATLSAGRLRMRQANARMINLGWLMSPRSESFLMDIVTANGVYVFRDEMDNGKLRGLPYAVTTQIPENLGGGGNESEVYLVDFNDVIIGESQRLIIDVSTEAAYHDGSNVVAAFSLDQTLIRAIAEHDIGLRYDSALVVIQTVKWGV